MIWFCCSFLGVGVSSHLPHAPKTRGIILLELFLPLYTVHTDLYSHPGFYHSLFLPARRVLLVKKNSPKQFVSHCNMAVMNGKALALKFYFPQSCAVRNPTHSILLCLCTTAHLTSFFLGGCKFTLSIYVKLCVWAVTIDTTVVSGVVYYAAFQALGLSDHSTRSHGMAHE